MDVITDIITDGARVIGPNYISCPIANANISTFLCPHDFSCSVCFSYIRADRRSLL